MLKVDDSDEIIKRATKEAPSLMIYEVAAFDGNLGCLFLWVAAPDAPTALFLAQVENFNKLLSVHQVADLFSKGLPRIIDIRHRH
jgi:hypothetical protein